MSMSCSICSGSYNLFQCAECKAQHAHWDCCCCVMGNTCARARRPPRDPRRARKRASGGTRGQLGPQPRRRRRGAHNRSVEGAGAGPKVGTGPPATAGLVTTSCKQLGTPPDRAGAAVRAPGAARGRRFFKSARSRRLCMLPRNEAHEEGVERSCRPHSAIRRLAPLRQSTSSKAEGPSEAAREGGGGQPPLKHQTNMAET